MAGGEMDIDGFKATVTFDPEISMFRGEFLGIGGGGDFYAALEEELERQGRLSLRIYLELCAENGIDPRSREPGRPGAGET
mgnify:CR=1 FL=1